MDLVGDRNRNSSCFLQPELDVKLPEVAVPDNGEVERLVLKS